LLSKLWSIFIRLQLRCLAFPAGKRRLRTSQIAKFRSYYI